jgi:hypothetical protein
MPGASCFAYCVTTQRSHGTVSGSAVPHRVGQVPTVWHSASIAEPMSTARPGWWRRVRSMLICRTESAETGCSGDGVPTSSGPRCTKSSMSDAATPVRPSRSVPSKADTAHAAPYAPSACRRAGVIAAARPVRSTTVRPASADRRSSEASASVSHTTGAADSTTIAEPTTSSMRGCLTIRVLLGSGLELPGRYTRGRHLSVRLAPSQRRLGRRDTRPPDGVRCAVGWLPGENPLGLSSPVLRGARV